MQRDRGASGRRQDDFFVRSIRCPGGEWIQRQAVRNPQHGGEAEARRSAIESGDHRPIHSDSGDFRLPGEDARPGLAANLQLTDGMRMLLKQEKMYAYVYEGSRYDTGDKLGFLKATVEFALKRDDLGGPFREYLKG